MKKTDILSLLSLFAAPLGLVLAGAVLAFVPDVLTFLLSRFLGWALLLVGLGIALSAIFKPTASKVLWALALTNFGGFFRRNPMFLARQAGLFLGLMLAIQGIREVRRSNGRGRPLGIATIVVGLVLVCSPLTASRMVFSLCGVAMVIVGIVLGLDKWKNRRYLDEGSGPNIIDAL